MAARSVLKPRGVSVLVTGATGFVGSHLTRALVARGYRVGILTRASSSMARLADVADRVQTFDAQEVLSGRAFERLGPVAAVAHLVTLYGRGNEATAEIFETNVLLPLKLMEAAARYGAALFVNTDTYSAKGETLYSHLSQYCLSKKQLAEWGRLLARTLPLSIANMRIEHVYGPDDDGRKFVPAMIRECLANVPRIKLTPGMQQRDFVYVADVAEAYIRVIESGARPGFVEYEVGTGAPVTVRECAETVHRMTASTSELGFGDLPYREGEVMVSRAATAELERLGWKAATSLETGLRRTIASERAPANTGRILS